MGHKRYLPINHLWRRNKQTFDGNQELECTPDVLGGDKILRQLEGMIFEDYSAGKEPKPTEKSKIDNKKKQKKTPKKRQPMTNEKM
jgi:hypothetical protein